MLLKDKVAIVTGAASLRGIGWATARRFAEEGARVALLDLDAGAAAKAAGEIGPEHRGYACDVRGGVIDDCGHWIPEEHPERITDEMSRFLE